VRRFARDLEPTVRSSGPALDATLPFVKEMRGFVSAPELQGLVKDLRPTVPSLVELNRGGVKLQEQTRALGSCNNLVIHDWNEESVPDPNFKSSGPIYQAASKQFTGLAAESRSFDANGQYVRSYANNANFATLLGDGRFYLSEQPFQGVNPPRKRGGAPAYRPDVPCETQERPDLRSKPDAAPPTMRINQNAPGAAARRDEANERLLAWMKRSMKQSGMDERYELSDKPLRADQIDDVKRTLEGGR
jgi:hypothetical protein